MKKKIAQLRQVRGEQIKQMEANVACSTEQEKAAYDSAKKKMEELDAQLKLLESIPAEEEDTDVVLASERTRAAEINKLAKKAGIDPEKAIKDGVTVESFRITAFDALAAKSETFQTQGHAATVTRDKVDASRALMSSALAHRLDGRCAVEDGNEFRTFSAYELAKECVELAGRKTRGLPRATVVEFAMQGTTDFPLILENSARKAMLSGYQFAAPTYRTWARGTTTPDFKTMSRYHLSAIPAFLTVPEGAQVQPGPMTESREQYAISTAGRGISFTRQMLINDDVNAFGQLIQGFGVQAARYENKTVYAILTANAALSDTVALFHATHANLGTGAIGNTGLGALFAAMRLQKDLDGVTVLNIMAKYLIVPATLEPTANNAMLPTGANVKASDQNWFASRLTVVSDAELDGTSTAVWYGAAEQMQSSVEYCHLEGAAGPQIVREDNANGVLGVTFYGYLDFGAKAVDFRTIYKSSGV